MDRDTERAIAALWTSVRKLQQAEMIRRHDDERGRRRRLDLRDWALVGLAAGTLIIDALAHHL